MLFWLDIAVLAGCLCRLGVLSEVDVANVERAPAPIHIEGSVRSVSLPVLSPKQCDYPKGAFSFLVKKMCPAADPLCILDAPFDFLADLKIRCSTAVRRDNTTVELMNSSELLRLISAMNDNEDLPLCMLTAFYAPECIFSARMAPFLNALPRAYPQLRVVACDASEYSRLHTRYGISGTPTIILWLDGMGVARMDDPPFSLDAFKEFIEKWTDLESIRSVSLQEADFEGPLPSHVKEGQVDWYLWLSSVAMILSSAYFFTVSKYGQSLWEIIRTNYVEANEAR
ncbi:Thioredoxin domain-containing protein 15 [Toxocara canis]|uniref:Thioredoxin domain-containing protein 15 n=1 Tax=Toxocara canis TaxID=6265 RepID=A0A0B2VUU5_TOXCA|nr:Thioredoxin domain-containing protein 15 [Toxocara canis]